MNKEIEQLSKFFKQKNTENILDEDYLQQQLQKIQGIYESIKIQTKKPKTQPLTQSEFYQVNYTQKPIYEIINNKYKENPQQFQHDYQQQKLPQFPLVKKQISLPYFLTVKEKSKLRKEKKIQKQEKKLEQILLGNIPKPKQRATLKNMNRVYPKESQTDPTKLELKIKKEIKEREESHKMQNEIRKLNKDQKWEKRTRKIKRDMSKGLFMFYYEIEGYVNYSSAQKILMYAKKHFINGKVIIPKEEIFANQNFLIVESGESFNKKFFNRVQKILSKQEKEQAFIKELKWSEKIKDHFYKGFSII